ncbi:MAG: hypothetical protein WC867_06430 [Candidatus Pacearchaeota archaeon]|jgi:hypothetical protein
MGKEEDIIEKNSRLREGNISIVLDSYDDIFSDFDPRPIIHKGLSDDFLYECRKASYGREAYEIRFMIPKRKRNPHEEIIIKKRMKEHFKKHLHEEEKKIKGIKKTGYWWVFLGSIILTISTLIYEINVDPDNKLLRFIWDLLFIISQPAGWFTFWEGLGKIFIHSKDNSQDHIFYKKMNNINIHFVDY